MPSILQLLDAAPNPVQQAEMPIESSEFSKSLRAGGYGARSTLQSAAGLVGEALGFDEFAKNRNADAAELQAQAQANAPRIGSYKQVLDSPDFSTGLRNAGDYVTGLVGSSLPIMGAGLVGGVGGGAAAAGRAIAGSALATVPFNVGDVAQKQLADPEAMKAPAGTRLRDALVGGGVASVVDGVVPGMVAGKILGQGAKTAARQTLRQTVGNNLASIPMEGATEAGSEAIKQYASNQNKPLDVEALKESFVGGSAAGGAFAGVGTVADLAHGNAAAVGNAARSATSFVGDAASKLVDRTRSAASTAQTEAPKKFKTISEDIGELMQKGRQYADDAIDKVMTGQPFVDAQTFATEAGQKFSDNERVKATAKWADDIANDAGLTPERREQAAAFAADIGNQASQVGLAALKKTVDAGRFMAEKIDGLRQSFEAGRNQYKRGDADVDATEIKQSADYSGTNKAIAESMGLLIEKIPGLSDRPGDVVKLADNVRRAVEVLPSLRLNSDTISRLIDVLGDQTMSTLSQAYRTVKADDPAAAEVFFKKLNEVNSLQQRTTQLKDLVGGALTEQAASMIKPQQYGELVNGLLKHARGEYDRPNAGPYEIAARNEEFRSVLREHFGDKADAVSLAIEKEAKLGKGVEADVKEGDFTEDGERITAEALDTKQFGYGKDNAPVMDSAVFRSTGQQGMDRAAQLLIDIKAKYPDHDVRFERLPGSSMGHVIAEKAQDTDGFSDADLEGMRLDTKKYSKSPDRLEVTTDNGKLILDSRRIAGVMDKRMPYSKDGQPRAERLAEMFSEGVARLQAKFGTFDVPDTIVIGRIGGKDMTFGDVKKLDRRTAADREYDKVTQDLIAKREEYKTASPENKLRIKEEADALTTEREKFKNRELTAERNDSAEKDESVREPGKDGEINRATFELGDKPALYASGDKRRTKAPTKEESLAEARKDIRDTSPSDKLVNKSNMDGSARFTSDRPDPENMKPARALMILMREADTAIGKKLADRLEVLLKHTGKMAQRDRLKLAGLGDDLSPSEVAEIINPIAVKYKDVITKTGDGKAAEPARVKEAAPSISAEQRLREEKYSDLDTVEKVDEFLSDAYSPYKNGVDDSSLQSDLERMFNNGSFASTDLASFYDGLRGGNAELDHEELLRKFSAGGNPSPKSLAAKKAALLEAASSSDPALLKELSTTDDAAALQRTVAELPPGTAADAANTRMAELVQDPDVAYGLQTKKYSMDGTRLHMELEREGFGATHDSPIRHEGKFDWRAHQGKGEGNASFGAGTYLSTAEGVHKSYKKQFTATVENIATASLMRAVKDAEIKLGDLKEKAREVDPWGRVDTPEARALDRQIKDAISALYHAESAMLSASERAKSPTYEVSVNIKPEQLLDWDAPLSEQSELVREKLNRLIQFHDISGLIRNRELKQIEGQKVVELWTDGGNEILKTADGKYFFEDANGDGVDRISSGLFGLYTNPTGREMYDFLTGSLDGKVETTMHRRYGLGSQAKASDYLQSLGILGHKYAASGGMDDVNPNYVIYDDSKITTNYVHFDKSKSGNTKTDTAGTRQAVEQYIKSVLGDSVKLKFEDMSHAGEFERVRLNDIIRLSTTALDPMSTAHHEALHAFFAQLRDAKANDIIAVIDKAASSDNVIRQLNEIYKGNDPVLAQLKDPEERAAYMYQHWAAGNLTIGFQPRTALGKIAAFIRSVLGIWSNDQRALAILEHFNSGEYAASGRDVGATRREYMLGGRNQALEAAKSFAAPLTRFADAVVSTGSGRVRDTGIPALIRLADIVKREATDAKGGDQGFIAAARLESTKRSTALAEALKDFSQDELHEAMEALQRGRSYSGANGDRIRAAQAVIKATLADTRSYLLAAGVNIGDLGPDYFPRVWDSHYISKNQQAFKDMLEPYIRSGEHKGSADDLIRDLMARDGNEFGIDRKKLNFDEVEARPPGMQFKKKRTLSYITPEDAAMFVTKDLLGTLTTYIHQSARKAEWTRRLGGGKLEALIEQAKEEGATPEQLKMTDTYLRGVDGTLGDSINPHARRVMGNMIVYQNIRLLPFAIFSSIVDPMGVLVRGGSARDAFATFKRGIMEIPKGLGKQSADDRATEIAELVGVIDSAVLANTLGDVYTQGMVGGFAKKANTMFFKYNLMEGFNRSFRIGASEAAIKFIARHADGKDSRHSQRWIDELGLQAGDVIPTADGRIALTVAEGLSLEQERRVHAAINQWVDGAVLRPDAADKPIWFNDPHWALVSHLKQFVYSFQKTILERVVHEYRQGNYTPAMAIASYVPMMMAADFIKGMIQGGGEQPEWKKGWDMVDYTTYAVQRAGLFGVGQFGIDAAKNVQEGGIGIGALTGPTVEQFTDVVQLLGGHKEFGPMVLNALPANALYKNAFNDDAPDSPGITK